MTGRFSALDRNIFIKYGHLAFGRDDKPLKSILIKASKTKTKSGNPTAMARRAKAELKKRRRK